MLDYADLLAGRSLIASGLLGRGEIIKRLAAHDLVPSQRAQFVSNLVKERILSASQGRKIFQIIQRHKRSLAQAVYLEHLRCMKAIDKGALRRAFDEYERDPGGDSLNKILFGEGLVNESEHRRLCGLALEAIERKQIRLIRRFRKSLKHHSSRTEVIEADVENRQGGLNISNKQTWVPVDSAAAQNIEIPLAYEPEPEALREANSTTVVRASVAAEIARAPETDRGPRFQIPSWIQPAGDLEGETLCGYRILGKIGEGGMGVVYYAEHDNFDEPLALKLLPPEKVHDEDALGRFHREILAMSFFDHENVVAIKDAGPAPDGTFFLAMEFVDGCELMTLLEDQDVIPPRQVLPIFRDVLLGLGAAHDSGILHRDLKPENILVSYRDDVAKLMDFGIARIMDCSTFGDKIYRSMAGTVTGTPEYLSPEQAADFPVDQRSDLYSFGVLMYLCLSGDFPIEAEDPQDFIHAHMTQRPRLLHSHNPDVPFKLSKIVMRLLEKEPDDRFQTCQELIAALDRVLRFL